MRDAPVNHGNWTKRQLTTEYFFLYVGQSVFQKCTHAHKLHWNHFPKCHLCGNIMKYANRTWRLQAVMSIKKKIIAKELWRHSAGHLNDHRLREHSEYFKVIIYLLLCCSNAISYFFFRPQTKRNLKKVLLMLIHWIATSIKAVKYQRLVPCCVLQVFWGGGKW